MQINKHMVKSNLKKKKTIKNLIKLMYSLKNSWQRRAKTPFFKIMLFIKMEFIKKLF